MMEYANDLSILKKKLMCIANIGRRMQYGTDRSHTIELGSLSKAWVNRDAIDVVLEEYLLMAS